MHTKTTVSAKATFICRFTCGTLSVLAAAASLFLVSLFITNYSFLSVHPVSLMSPFFFVFTLTGIGAVFFLRRCCGCYPLSGWHKFICSLDDKVVLAVASVFLSAVIFTLSWTRYNSYSSNFDLAIYEQIIWNSAHGRFFVSSIMGDCNSLGNHFEPVLLFLAPFYRMFPDVRFLFAVQALALSSAMIPLYLIAKRRLESRVLVCGVVAAYFLSRGIQGAGMFEFHPDCFLPLLLLYAYYLLITSRRRGAVWMCLLMLLCKENAAFLVLGLGIFAMTRKESRRTGFILSAAALLYWIILTKFVMPVFFRPLGAEQYQYYAWLPFGPSIKDNFTALARDPAGFIRVFFDEVRLRYYFQLLGPTGFLALLSPAHYALFMLPAGIFVLGSFGHLGLLNIMAQYSAHTVPAVFIAAVSGLTVLQKKLFLKFPGYKERISLILSLYFVFFAAGFYGKTSGHRISKFIRAGKDIGAENITAALRKYIPDDASVTATINVSAHLSRREKLYLLEEMRADSNYPRLNGVKSAEAEYKENLSLSRRRYESDYIVAHKKLSGDKFPSILEQISGHGYSQVYRDAEGLQIFKKERT